MIQDSQSFIIFKVLNQNVICCAALTCWSHNFICITFCLIDISGVVVFCSCFVFGGRGEWGRGDKHWLAFSCLCTCIFKLSIRLITAELYSLTPGCVFLLFIVVRVGKKCEIVEYLKKKSISQDKSKCAV